MSYSHAARTRVRGPGRLCPQASGRAQALSSREGLAVASRDWLWPEGCGCSLVTLGEPLGQVKGPAPPLCRGSTGAEPVVTDPAPGPSPARLSRETLGAEEGRGRASRAGGRPQLFRRRRMWQRHRVHRAGKAVEPPVRAARAPGWRPLDSAAHRTTHSRAPRGPRLGSAGRASD